MGLFSRRERTQATEPAADQESSSDWEVGDDAGPEVSDTGRPTRPETTTPGEEDRGRVETALRRLADLGGDVDDLASLGTAYDSAVARHRTGEVDRDDAVEVIGLAIGEHLVRHASMDWKVVTDVFGTDLGVSARRADLTVVPTNIVATRWINGETGWLPGVVGHLVRLGDNR